MITKYEYMYFVANINVDLENIYSRLIEKIQYLTLDVFPDLKV